MIEYAPIIGIGQLSAVLPIIGIGRLVRWYQPTVNFFGSLRPFSVVQPTIVDRETCRCKTHENLTFMVPKLYAMNILKTNNLDELADSICCNPKSKECAYCECRECALNVPECNRFEQTASSMFSGERRHSPSSAVQTAV